MESTCPTKREGGVLQLVTTSGGKVSTVDETVMSRDRRGSGKGTPTKKGQKRGKLEPNIKQWEGGNPKGRMGGQRIFQEQMS